MLTTLVATIGNMPLKSEIFHDNLYMIKLKVPAGSEVMTGTFG